MRKNKGELRPVGRDQTVALARTDHRIAARWTPRLAAQGYTAVTNVFLEAYAELVTGPGERGLNSTEAMLIVHLMSFKWDGRLPFPKVGLLARRMGLTTRAVRAALKSLEDRGLVARERVPNEIANRYDLGGLFTALEAWMDGSTPKVTAA